MTENKVKVKNHEDETLVGIEVLPEGRDMAFPTIIMVHGFDYVKEEDGMFVELGKRLAEIGVASYRFDFSGCGESEGDYTEVTLTKLKDDLAVIFEFVKKRPTTDVSRLGALAQSFGTTVTVSLAPDVKTAVLMGSFINPTEVFRNYFGKGYHPDGISTKPHNDGRITELKPAFWRDLDEYDLLSNLRNMKYPILLVHASEDENVPLQSMEQIFSNAVDPKKVILDGASHDLKPKREEMYKIVVEWFQKQL